MKVLESRILWGGLLVLAGVLFLVQNLGIFRIGDLFWVALLALAGAFFLSIFLQNKTNWWPLIPGLTLFSVGSIVLLNWISPDFGERWNGSIILAGIGLSFALVYLIARSELVGHYPGWSFIYPGCDRRSGGILSRPGDCRFVLPRAGADLRSGGAAAEPAGGYALGLDSRRNPVGDRLDIPGGWRKPARLCLAGNFDPGRGLVHRTRVKEPLAGPAQFARPSLQVQPLRRRFRQLGHRRCFYRTGGQRIQEKFPIALG